MTPPAAAAPSAGERAEVAESLSDELRLHRRVAVPIVATFLVELGMWYTDAIIVGRLGAAPFAAVGLLGGLFWETLFVCFALLSIAGVLIGNAYGAGDTAGVRRAFRHGVMLGALLCPPVMLLAAVTPDLLAPTGQEPEVLRHGESYVMAVLWSAPAVLWFTALRGLATALSRPGLVTLVSAVSLPFNAALTWWFVFGGWGIDAMGVAGAAWATVVTTWLGLGALAAAVACWRPVARFRPFDDFFAMDAGVWRRIARLGLPVAGVRVVEGASYQALKIAMGAFGAAALAAHHVVASIAGLSTTLVIAIAHAGIVRVSQEMGARRPAAMLRAGWVAIAAATATAAVVAVLMLAAPLDAASIFLAIDDPANADARSLIAPLATVAAPLIVFEAVHIAATRALRGRHDTWVPMWISSAGAWLVAVPLGLALAFSWGVGPVGLWWGLGAGYMVTGVLMARRWRRGPTPFPPARNAPRG